MNINKSLAEDLFDEKYPLYEKIADIIYCKIRNFFRPVKFAYQRVVRGFDESATWSVDYYLIEHTLKLLQEYKRIRFDFIAEREEFERDFELILKGFEGYKKLMNGPSLYFWSGKIEPENEQYLEDWKIGFRLFRKQFHGIWW